MSVISFSISIFFKNQAFYFSRLSSYAFSVLATYSSIFFNLYLLLSYSCSSYYYYLCCLARIYYSSSFFRFSFSYSMSWGPFDYASISYALGCGSSLVIVLLNCSYNSFNCYSSFIRLSSNSFNYANLRLFSSYIRLFFCSIY